MSDYRELLAKVQAEFDEERYNSAPAYTHAFVGCALQECSAALPEITKSTFAPDTLLFGARRDLKRCKLYVTSKDEGTLLWLPIEGLKLIQALSLYLQTTIHWISVIEAFTVRAYIRFDNGLVTEKLFDSETYWQQNIMYGQDLTGRGVRQFASLEAFLAQIKTYYVPRDTQWSYEKLELNPQENLLCLEWTDK